MDFISDQSGRHLLRINDIVTLPDYVKQASIIDANGAKTLSITCFADPARKEFPIDTKAHVFLSHAYCKSAGVKTSWVLERIKKAAGKLGIDKDLETVDQAFAQTKKASKSSPPDKKYAIVLNFDTGMEKAASELSGLRGFYPINDVVEIQNSAIELDNHKHRLPLALYVDSAREIVKAARDLDMEDRLLPGRILMYGTEHHPDFDYVEKEARRREAITGDSAYSMIAKSASANTENVDMNEYAKLWELADASNGVSTYSKSIPDPFLIFNVGVNKRAYEDAVNRHIMLGGAIVPIEAIAQIEEVEIPKHFPKTAVEMVKNLVKAAMVFDKTGSGDEVVLAAEELDAPIQKALLRLVSS